MAILHNLACAQAYGEELSTLLTTFISANLRARSLRLTMLIQTEVDEVLKFASH